MKSQAFRVALLGLMGTTAAAPSEVKRASMSGSSLIAALAELSEAMEPVMDPIGQIIASLLNLNTNSGYRSSSGVLQGDLSHQMSQVARGMTSDDMIDYISSTAARRAKKAGGSSGFIMVPYSGAETTDDLTSRSTDAIDPLSSLLGSILNPTSTSGNLLTNLISGSLPSASNNPVASLISGVVSGVTSALPTSGAVASILKNLSPTGTVASLLSAIIPTSLPNLGLTAGLNLTPGAFINNLVNTIQQGLQKIAALISSTKLTLMNVIIKPKLVTEEVRALAHGILFVTVESLLASSAGLTTVGTLQLLGSLGGSWAPSLIWETLLRRGLSQSIGSKCLAFEENTGEIVIVEHLSEFNISLNYYP
ncbi:hypothetical protein GQ53DRAFT_803479 [Thozetella sp. PMI_491]|nr:hypothetical protein GQ53DRAFT_803479 [Thozetella sp. PMI_491]